MQRDLNLLSGSREDCWDNVKDDIKRNIQDLEISLKKRNVLVEKLEAKVMCTRITFTSHHLSLLYTSFTHI